MNLIVRELEPLERFLDGAADGEVAEGRVHRLPTSIGAPQTPEEGEEEGAAIGSSIRAVAPPVQSFAAGRRR